MNTWLPWLAIALCAVLLAAVGVLLYRVLRQGLKPPPVKSRANTGFIQASPDETMVISRQQVDEMLDK